MKLLTLPTELLIQIVQYLPSIQEKVQVLKTCSQLKQLLCTQYGCWTELDFSPHSSLSNGQLVIFLKSKGIWFYDYTPMITSINISGCWNLSENVIIGLSKSFIHLKELHLNGYKLTKNNKFQERDHLYQMRPSHDLSSMTMDLSKETIYQLKVPLNTLLKIIGGEENELIQILSIQYQDLTAIQYNDNYTIFNKITELDISSCLISQAGLQVLIRKIGKQLINLKMLNIDLSSLSWLTLGQYCKKLICLHISCTDPIYLGSIRQCLNNLNLLQDFRLTRLRTGNLDPIIERLNSSQLKKLDLSPKMNIYLNNNGTKKTTSCEHDLLISLENLFQFHQLTELRLCFPLVATSSLNELFQSLPQLKILELRRQQLQSYEDQNLIGLKYLIHLKELYLYSIFISNQMLEIILLLPSLQHLTILNNNDTTDYSSFFLNSNTSLNSMYFGQQLSFQKKDNQWVSIG